MALGSTRTQILMMILQNGIVSAIGGMLVGLTGAFFVNKVLANLLFDVQPEDPLAFVAVAGVLTAVAVVACYIPARRAARLDPLVTLRCE
jgi:ABC-type antimicrobial peptide transport system permease subunit